MTLLPTPRHLEEKVDFVARFQSHSRAKSSFRDFGRRHSAAEEAWKVAKGKSIVSFKGYASEFLVLEDY